MPSVVRVREKKFLFFLSFFFLFFIFFPHGLLSLVSFSFTCLLFLLFNTTELTSIRKQVLQKLNPQSISRLFDAAKRVVTLKLKIWATNLYLATIPPSQQQQQLRPTPSPIHLYQSDGRPLPLLSSASNQRVLFVIPNTLRTTIKNLTMPLLTLGQDVRTIEYHQQPGCRDLKNIQEAVTWSGTTIIMLHNYNTDHNVLMHALYPEQIDLVRALAKNNSPRLVASSLRMIVVSNENPFDLRYLSTAGAGAGAAAGGGQSPGLRGGVTNDHLYLRRVALVANYDVGPISMHGLSVALHTQMNYPNVQSIMDVGFLTPATLGAVPNRPCPTEENFHGNDPASHMTRWSKQEREERERGVAGKRGEEEKEEGEAKTLKNLLQV